MANAIQAEAPPGNTGAVLVPKFGKGLRVARGAATRPLQQAGDMLGLLIEVLRSAVTHPTG
jgi:phospholipid/cholesterol/gamma-HCH transport system permease protein